MLFFKYEGKSALRGHGGALELKLPVDKKVSIGLRQMDSSTDRLFDGRKIADDPYTATLWRRLYSILRLQSYRQNRKPRSDGV